MKKILLAIACVLTLTTLTTGSPLFSRKRTT